MKVRGHAIATQFGDLVPGRERVDSELKFAVREVAAS
jgi:hypothetical protein